MTVTLNSNLLFHFVILCLFISVACAAEIEVRSVSVDILPPSSFILQWKTLINGTENVGSFFEETNVTVKIDEISVYDGPTTNNTQVVAIAVGIVVTKVYYFDIIFKLMYVENQQRVLKEIAHQLQYQYLPTVERIEFEKYRDSLFSPSFKCHLKVTLNTTISTCKNVNQLAYEISRLDGTVTSKQLVLNVTCTFETIIELLPNQIYSVVFTQLNSIQNYSRSGTTMCETDPSVQLIDPKLGSLKIDDSLQLIQLSHPNLTLPATRRVYYWVFLLKNQWNVSIETLVANKELACPNNPYCTFLTTGQRYNLNKTIQIRKNANVSQSVDTDYYFYFSFDIDLKRDSLVLLYAIYPNAGQRNVQHFQGTANVLYVSSLSYQLSMAQTITQATQMPTIMTFPTSTQVRRGLLDYEIGIICAIMGIVLGAAATCAIVYYIRRKRMCRKRLYQEKNQEKKAKDFERDEDQEKKTRQAQQDEYECDVDAVEEFWLKKKADSNLVFEKEYQKLPDYRSMKSVDAANANAMKNRFNDVKPFDDTRVVLKGNMWENGLDCDYINANFVSGYSNERKFIATQGPLKHTVADFWHMIVQFKSNAVVMLANLFENEKERCAQYWPDELDGRVCYGEYEVALVRSLKVHDYVKRTLEVRSLKSMQEKPLVVSQYFYPEWPDRDRPTTDCMSVLHLISDVHRRHSLNPGPIVVHCSAGVGRTGTYITLDAMMEQIKKERKFNVFAFVSKIRGERQTLVQTSKQYVFIHEAIHEYIQFGFTDVKNSKLQAYCKEKLQQTASLCFQQKAGLLEAEFEKLSSLQATNKAPPRNIATKASNKHFNRDRNIVCFDENRVKLSALHGQSYINATRILGLGCDQNAFIITQDPLEDTIFEFWKMISEYSCQVIVCLNRDYLKEKTLYFPSGEERLKVVEQGGLKYTITTVEDHDPTKTNITVRQFEVATSKHSDTTTFKVTLFLLNEKWTENEVPMHCSTLLNLISQVHRLDSKPPIVVHANGGGSNCSVFCALSILIKQLENDEYVDICRTVKKLKSQRSNMIQSFTQYKFLHQCLYEYTKIQTEQSTL